LILFSPPRCLKATVLQESEGEHRHERVAVKTLPGSPLEVVEAEFLLHLLMRLLANPSCLYGGGQSAQIGRGRQIGEVVLLLSRRPVFADEPSLIPWEMLLTLVTDPLRWSVGDPHTDGGKASFVPLVPVRQLTVFHLASASISSAGIDRIFGTCRCRGRPRLATGQIICTPKG
jgi:hypothetical protein